MYILAFYLLRAHIGPFLFGTFTVAFVFLLNFLIIFLPQIVGKGLTLWVIIQLIALNLAWIVVIAIPLGVLTATLMAFGNLTASNEITMIRSGGASLLQMMMPIMLVGLLLSGALYWFNDEVLPEANHRALTLRMDIERKKPTFVLDKGQFSTQLDGYSILARRLDTAQGTMFGVTIYDNTKFDQTSVLSADTGYINFSSDYKKVILMLHEGELHQLSANNPGDYRRVRFKSHRVLMDASGFEFANSDAKLTSRGDRTMKIRDMENVVRESYAVAGAARGRITAYITIHSNDISRASTTATNAADNRQQTTKITQNIELSHTPALSSRELQQEIPQIQSHPHAPQEIQRKDTACSRKEAAWRAESRMSGVYSSIDNDLFYMRERELNAGKYLVEVHKKYVIPLACFVFVLIGCPLGVVTRRGNLGVSGLITIAFYVVYWAFLMTGERLADRGLIEPRLSMWLADIVLGGIGIFLMLRVGKDAPLVSETLTNALLPNRYFSINKRKHNFIVNKHHE